MAKVQLALDALDMEDALALARKVACNIDIFEMGTPFLMKYGQLAIRTFRKEFPDHEILADYKIMDAGYFETKLAYEAGADYATVLGATDYLTLKECQRAAEECGRKLFVDTICVGNLEERVHQIDELGIYGISVHTGVDQQAAGKTPLDELKEVLSWRKNAVVSVAGGISAKNYIPYLEAGADILISGNGICFAEDPVKESAIISGRNL